MSIVTKQGDHGKTRLISGELVLKTHERVEALGIADELISQMGFARSFIKDAALAKAVKELQLELFRFAGELASSDEKLIQPTEKKHVDSIEERISALEKSIALPRTFLIPGATKESAALEVARTIARRLERQVVRLTENAHYTNPHGLVYVNRISDYLFLLCRAVEQSLNVPFEPKEGK